MDVDFTTDLTVLNISILLKIPEKPNVHRKVFYSKKPDASKLRTLLSNLPDLILV